MITANTRLRAQAFLLLLLYWYIVDVARCQPQSQAQPQSQQQALVAAATEAAAVAVGADLTRSVATATATGTGVLRSRSGHGEGDRLDEYHNLNAAQRHVTADHDRDLAIVSKQTERLEAAQYLLSKSISIAGTGASTGTAAMGIPSKDFRRAVAILEELARSEDALVAGEALADLAHINAFGSRGYSKIDLYKAFELVNRSASLGSPRGAHLLAFYYHYGIVVESDALQAARLIEQAANRSFLPSLMALGNQLLASSSHSALLFSRSSCELALQAYQAAASLATIHMQNAGSDYAAFQALDVQGDILDDTLPARRARDTETLQYWEFQAHKKNSKRGMHELGVIFYRGLLGVPRDPLKALAYFRQASELNYAPSMSELGRLMTLPVPHSTISTGGNFSTGTFPPHKDLRYALQLLQSATNAGNKSAMATLGRLVHEGILTSHESNIAMDYLKTAANHGDSFANWYLGTLDLSKGRMREAAVVLRASAAAGHIPALMALGDLYTKNRSQATLDAMTCESISALYKRVAEVGPWIDDHSGPREAIREFQAQREENALMLSLYSSFQGYSVAHFNAAWLLMRRASAIKVLPAKRFEAAVSAMRAFTSEHPNHAGAHVLMGEIYHQAGTRVHNYTLAADHYQTAAELGSAEGMERYSRQLYRGLGRPVDHGQAEKLLVHAMYRVVTRDVFQRGIGYVVAQIARMAVELAKIKVTSLLKKLFQNIFPSRSEYRFGKSTVRKISEEFNKRRPSNGSSTEGDDETEEKHARGRSGYWQANETPASARTMIMLEIRDPDSHSPRRCLLVNGTLGHCDMSALLTTFTDAEHSYLVFPFSHEDGDARPWCLALSSCPLEPEPSKLTVDTITAALPTHCGAKGWRLQEQAAVSNHHIVSPTAVIVTHTASNRCIFRSSPTSDESDGKSSIVLAASCIQHEQSAALEFNVITHHAPNDGHPASLHGLRISATIPQGPSTIVACADSTRNRFVDCNDIAASRWVAQLQSIPKDNSEYTIGSVFKLLKDGNATECLAGDPSTGDVSLVACSDEMADLYWSLQKGFVQLIPAILYFASNSLFASPTATSDSSLAAVAVSRDKLSQLPLHVAARSHPNLLHPQYQYCLVYEKIIESAAHTSSVVDSKRILQFGSSSSMEVDPAPFKLTLSSFVDDFSKCSASFLL